VRSVKRLDPTFKSPVDILTLRELWTTYDNLYKYLTLTWLYSIAHISSTCKH